MQGHGSKGRADLCHMNGEAIDTEKYWPIYEICEKLDLPILIHPVGGQMVPEFPTETRSKYELWFTIGWPYQTTVAMFRLAFSGIFEDFPNIKIITHHVGAMVPMLGGRIENGLKLYGSRTAPELKEELTKTKMKGDPLDTFKKYYADTASFGSTSAIRAGIDFFGVDHILFASDMPFDPEQGPGYIDRTLKCIDQLDITDEERQAILSGKRTAHFPSLRPQRRVRYMKALVISTLTNQFFLMFLAIATGLLIGKIKIKSFSLGVSRRYFYRIIIGYIATNWAHHAQEGTAGYSNATKDSFYRRSSPGVFYLFPAAVFGINRIKGGKHHRQHFQTLRD